MCSHATSQSDPVAPNKHRPWLDPAGLKWPCWPLLTSVGSAAKGAGACRKADWPAHALPTAPAETEALA